MRKAVLSSVWMMNDNRRTLSFLKSVCEFYGAKFFCYDEQTSNAA